MGLCDLNNFEYLKLDCYFHTSKELEVITPILKTRKKLNKLKLMTFL